MSGSPGTLKSEKITAGRWLNEMRGMRPEMLHTYAIIKIDLRSAIDLKVVFTLGMMSFLS